MRVTSPESVALVGGWLPMLCVFCDAGRRGKGGGGGGREWSEDGGGKNWRLRLVFVLQQVKRHVHPHCAHTMCARAHSEGSDDALNRCSSSTQGSTGSRFLPLLLQPLRSCCAWTQSTNDSALLRHAFLPCTHTQTPFSCPSPPTPTHPHTQTTGLATRYTRPVLASLLLLPPTSHRAPPRLVDGPELARVHHTRECG